MLDIIYVQKLKQQNPTKTTPSKKKKKKKNEKMTRQKCKYKHMIEVITARHSITPDGVVMPLKSVDLFVLLIEP